MASQITSLPITPSPVIPDFGWYYGSNQRLGEYTYTVGNSNYPPGYTVTAGGGSQTLSPTTSTSVIVASTASLEPSGQITFYAGTASTQHVTAPYTVVDATHIQVTGGSGTYPTGTPVYDPRFYVDQLPLHQLITFDAIDSQNLGLPKIQIPSGLSIASYQWDFGNGSKGFGPYASTTYTYSAVVPAIQCSLTITDSLGRRYSCSHHLVQQSLTSRFGATGRVNP